MRLKATVDRADDAAVLILAADGDAAAAENALGVVADHMCSSSVDLVFVLLALIDVFVRMP